MHGRTHAPVIRLLDLLAVAAPWGVEHHKRVLSLGGYGQARASRERERERKQTRARAREDADIRQRSIDRRPRTLINPCRVPDQPRRCVRGKELCGPDPALTSAGCNWPDRYTLGRQGRSGLDRGSGLVGLVDHVKGSCFLDRLWKQPNKASDEWGVRAWAGGFFPRYAYFIHRRYNHARKKHSGGYRSVGDRKGGTTRDKVMWHFLFSRHSNCIWELDRDLHGTGGGSTDTS